MKRINSIYYNEEEIFLGQDTSALLSKHEAETTYAKKSELGDLSGYSTTGHTHDLYLTAHQDLSGYSKTNHTHDEYITDDYLSTYYSNIGHAHDDYYSTVGHTHNYLTAHQSLSGYAKSDHDHDSHYSSFLHSHNNYYSKTDHKHDEYLISLKTINNTSLTGSGDIAINENTITVDGSTLKEKIDSIELFKYANLTLFGSPTIQNGQISGFSTTNYALFPFLVDFKLNTYVIEMSITTGSQVVNQENILDSSYGLAFAIRNGKFVVALSSNGTSWNYGETVLNYEITTNTTYNIKIEGTHYNASTIRNIISIMDSQTWNTVATINTLPLYPKQIIIGKAVSNSNVFSGSINLNQCRLTINNNIVWQGMDDAGLSTRLATDLSNIDNAGTNAIKDLIASNVTNLPYYSKTGHTHNYLQNNKVVSGTLMLNAQYDNVNNNDGQIVLFASHKQRFGVGNGNELDIDSSGLTFNNNEVLDASNWKKHVDLSGYSSTGHTHDGYSLVGHTHNYLTEHQSLSGYSTTEHTHDDYYVSSYTYAYDRAMDNSKYSKTDHTHSDYSLVGHTHNYLTEHQSLSGYSKTDHTHSDYSLVGHTHNYLTEHQSLSGYSTIGHTHDEYALKSELPTGGADLTNYIGDVSITSTEGDKFINLNYDSSNSIYIGTDVYTVSNNSGTSTADGQSGIKIGNDGVTISGNTATLLSGVLPTAYENEIKLGGATGYVKLHNTKIYSTASAFTIDSSHSRGITIKSNFGSITYPGVTIDSSWQILQRTNYKMDFIAGRDINFDSSTFSVNSSTFTYKNNPVLSTGNASEYGYCKIQKLTLTEYDALTEKDDNVLYVITD